VILQVDVETSDVYHLRFQTQILTFSYLIRTYICCQLSQVSFQCSAV